jgi:hypothetical protein
MLSHDAGYDSYHWNGTMMLVLVMAMAVVRISLTKIMIHDDK